MQRGVTQIREYSIYILFCCLVRVAACSIDTLVHVLATVWAALYAFHNRKREGNRDTHNTYSCLLSEQTTLTVVSYVSGQHLQLSAM